MDKVDEKHKTSLFSLQNKIKIISLNLNLQVRNRKKIMLISSVFTWRHLNKTFVKIINHKPHKKIVVFQSVFTNKSLNFDLIQMIID